jgi:hypothetical protein
MNVNVKIIFIGQIIDIHRCIINFSLIQHTSGLSPINNTVEICRRCIAPHSWDSLIL